eukprot:scaffold30222_cov71-Cyclotella_meneghiniana.AAC.3
MATITKPKASCSVGVMENSEEASCGVQEFDEAGQEVDSIATGTTTIPDESEKRKIRKNHG